MVPEQCDLIHCSGNQLTKVETRASINSYLLEAFAPVESAEAGRLFRKRLQRERREEQE